MLLPLFFVLFQLVSWTQCRQNITLDDNDTKLQYTGGWGQSASTDLDYGGSHALTSNTTAEAVLQFTGVAVYFMSPLWPYAVSTALTLDSRPTITVDLTDHNTPDTGGGIETVSSSVVWSAENLQNTNHTLRISVGRGELFAIVDGIIYTVLDPGESETGASGDRHNRVVIIVLATLLGILGLLLLIIIIWLCLRKQNSSGSRTRRRSLTTSEKWGGAAHDDASVADPAHRGSLQSPPLSPSTAPRTLPPPSRPDSNYNPRETTVWSTSSVGGPGVPNMTGVGASARNSNAISSHHGDPTHSTSHFAMGSQGDFSDPHETRPYLNPNRGTRLPNI
ncbi:hypothetical protein AGABI1DRAFT_113055 [Agaricus bisporus var. burnettii JB137-S8]|uniref:Mid2 domain-containing protein n=1 Tax=Agaricus bisporus var. burnettii (strain JB137-S8 / ATCC MYA-4627 / FGSC 10392) TaxID=597362 RepID=K5X962_AGABU|nr:uncharacterized protein AGABI1DRAFT_113055 [Agaricus bisporus var. burnettii JB137-S8]EKM79748.1 hypothetical protein AGABI1DRAFT_113055 [Agaricus bisporus var. burnettii JB137-S8]